MNSQAAEMLKTLENLRHIGADHLATPSTEQEKLDREWEYFETVCDQIFFILDNAKYKIKRQQNDLAQQLNPPTVLPSPPPQLQPQPELQPQPQPQPTQEQPIVIDPPAVSTLGDLSPSASTAVDPLAAIMAETSPVNVAPLTAAVTLGEPQDEISMNQFDLQMMSPPNNFDDAINTSGISTASLLSSAAAMAPAPDMNMNMNININIDDPLMSEEDKLQDTMLDLGDIGNLGDMGDMDDMINF
ncbi:hypothetical protein EC968_002905 [Mortierella alpina]|nr:hypothetical protein EC968_002905 [Mortierella alpina]